MGKLHPGCYIKSITSLEKELRSSCSTALLSLHPHQDGAAQVDTPTTPSSAQVHRHQILFVVPRAKIVKPPLCNTPDMIYPICTPTLAVSGLKLFYFLGFGSLSPCVFIIVMHLISRHHVHCILHTCSSHASEHFSPLFVLQSGTPMSSGVPFLSFFMSGC